MELTSQDNILGFGIAIDIDRHVKHIWKVIRFKMVQCLIY